MSSSSGVPASGSSSGEPGLVRPSVMLFDLDGTLTEPILDFPAIRAALGVASGAPILEYIDARERINVEEGQALRVRLHELELASAAVARPAAGLAELLELLALHSIGIAIVTRNSTHCAHVTMERIGIASEDFVLVTRDDAPPKPDPAPLKLALRQLGHAANRSWMIGDGHDDVLAGERAGCRERIWLSHARNTRPLQGQTRELAGLAHLHDLVRLAR